MLTLPDKSSARYRIYPSLLDSFAQMLDYEVVAEEMWNKKDGEYVLTPDEMYDKLEKELIATINREPHEPIEAASLGSVFNEIVDCLIEHRKSETMKIFSYCTEVEAYDHSIQTKRLVQGELDGFTFIFDGELCKEAAEYFRGALTQQYLEATIDTAYGDVLLYGYADEWVRDKIYDIKTTSYYDFGKFERKWQRHVYPYCAIESGLTDTVSEFEYTIFKLNKSTPITASVYREAYTYDHKETTRLLRQMCERFIEWLEAMNAKGLITHPRIFNKEAA